MFIPKQYSIITTAIVTLLVVGPAIQCKRQLKPSAMAKISFDYSSLDANGLRHGESSVDYEFCIPANEDVLADIQKIEPDVRVLKGSRGRVGCTGMEWLCIINTHDMEWKKKLYAIAALPYVERLAEVFYE